MSKEFEEHLVRFRNLPLPVRVVYARPRTFIALALGLVVFFLLPDTRRLATRLIVGWDVFAALYLVLAYIMMLHYAHDFYRGKKPGGLQFPISDTHAEADYWDFVYFSFVIGMTAQVSDVGITDNIIRRTATVHGIISFVFNTALLALMVNIAASAIAS